MVIKNNSNQYFTIGIRKTRKFILLIMCNGDTG